MGQIRAPPWPDFPSGSAAGTTGTKVPLYLSRLVSQSASDPHNRASGSCRVLDELMCLQFPLRRYSRGPGFRGTARYLNLWPQRPVKREIEATTGATPLA